MTATTAMDHPPTAACMVTLGAFLDARNVAVAREDFDRCLEASADEVGVDMSALRFIDATGLGLLTAVHLRCERAGRQLVLHNCSPEIRRVLAVTRLNRILRLDRSNIGSPD